MASVDNQRFGGLLPFGAVFAAALVIAFVDFFKTLSASWFTDPEFSYGILIPFIAVYLLWDRRSLWSSAGAGTSHPGGLALTIAGCGLHIIGSLSGTLVLSGLGLTITTMGVVLYLWGLDHLRIAGPPLILLVLMVPVPSYAVGEVSWYLQKAASSLSSLVLRLLGVPVFQDGNLLNLPNYVLEVKQACSGSRSIFALLAMAVILAITVERKWWTRVLLVSAAPMLAISANIVRIVGTGLIAKQWGALAASESLHMTWGIIVFVIAVAGLLAFQRILHWTTSEYA